MIREVDIIFIIIEKCIFDVNEGSLSGGDIVVRTDANDEELSDESLNVSLIEETVLGLVDLGRIEGLFEEVDDVLDLHGLITVNN